MLAVWTQLATGQDSFVVLTQFPVCNCSVSNILRIIENLEFGNWIKMRQNSSILGRDQTTVMSCLQLCSHHRRVQDKTVLCCPCRRCEQATTQCLPPRHTLLNTNYWANMSDPWQVHWAQNSRVSALQHLKPSWHCHRQTDRTRHVHSQTVHKQFLQLSRHINGHRMQNSTHSSAPTYTPVPSKPTNNVLHYACSTYYTVHNCFSTSISH